MIAAIASAELPHQQWPDLLPALVKNVNGVGPSFNRQLAIQLGGSVSLKLVFGAHLTLHHIHGCRPFFVNIFEPSKRFFMVRFNALKNHT